jgi:hypothetical protein
MWWNHGGVLNGGSPPRLAWFRAYVDALPVPFAALSSHVIQPGVYWLRSADYAYSLVCGSYFIRSNDLPVTPSG